MKLATTLLVLFAGSSLGCKGTPNASSNSETPPANTASTKATAEIFLTYYALPG